MNKREKEVLQAQLDAEKAVLKELEKQYKRALTDIEERVKLFDYDLNRLDTAMSEEGLDDAAKSLLQSQRRSRVYQKQYQEALRGQINGILDKLHGDEYATIQQYLDDSYTNAFIGTMYDIAGQGVPLILPIDQAAAVRAVQLESKVVKGYYDALGVDINDLKKTIKAEVSRGIANGMNYSDIARNINNAAKTGRYNAQRIARTEGHRIQQASTMDAQNAAKAKGADVVKQWDATLDGKTRPTHRHLDGQIREIDEFFEVGGMKAKAPGYFGRAAEDINCRCVSLTRARWALDDDELDTLKKRAEYFGLDKAKDFDDFKEKYLKAAAESEEQWGFNYDNTDVDFGIIDSDEYKSKFEQITDNPSANESIYDVVKTMLQHCDGTEHEDMYLLNMDGAIIAKVTDSASRLGVNYTEEFVEALEDAAKNKTPVIAIHNHPYGTPPSSDDFRKAYENHYAIGVVAGHNGQVYVYTNNGVKLTAKDCDVIEDEIKTLYLLGKDIDNCSRDIYNEHGLSYTILKGEE